MKLRSIIHAIEHPEVKSGLHNTIFCDQPNGKPISMEWLKGRIAEMVKMVKYKNQWFCVWCVLKHRNLLSDLHFEAFAKQMMHKEWFGQGKAPVFTGENISDYHDYLGDIDFNLWSLTDFQNYRTLHSKPLKKWSDFLFNTFHHLCHEMDKVFTD